jgi:hypothetical protein
MLLGKEPSEDLPVTGSLENDPSLQCGDLSALWSSPHSKENPRRVSKGSLGGRFVFEWGVWPNHVSTLHTKQLLCAR